jgi:hypothetical protein
MHNNAYVREVIERHQPTLGTDGARAYIDALRPVLEDWGGEFLESIDVAGAVATGTAIAGTTDLDLILVLRPDTKESLEDVHETLYNKMEQLGLGPVKRKAAVAIVVGDVIIDLIPAKRPHPTSPDHHIWLHRGRHDRRTNFATHIKYVAESGRQPEIRAVKIWCKQQDLYFPTLFLELLTIKALIGYSSNAPAANFVRVLEYIRDNIETVVISDPSNPENIISNEMSPEDKQMLAMFARASLTASWNEVLW